MDTESDRPVELAEKKKPVGMGVRLAVFALAITLILAIAIPLWISVGIGMAMSASNPASIAPTLIVLGFVGAVFFATYLIFIKW